MRHALFRKTKEAPETAPVVDKPQGKGRPTPSRKEAEAARRERARAGMDKKTAKRVLRDRQAERNRMMREGMKRGDEKYLMPRDQGPVRRYIRDWVDARLSFTEFLLPMLLVIMLLQWSGNDALMSFGNGLWTASIFLILVDLFWMSYRLRRDLRAKFPDESHKGAFFYAVLRSLQLRFMRLPKPRVRIGGKPVTR
jgi:hypothetical protein